MRADFRFQGGRGRRSLGKVLGVWGMCLFRVRSSQPSLPRLERTQ